MGEMPCDVCGSFKHEDHPQCSYCGSDHHSEHPTCSYCGSFDHEDHPRCHLCGSYDHEDHPRCHLCGSYDHEAHPRCPACGAYDHEVHPRCPVCGSGAHTDHEEDYLTDGDIGMYWTTLRVFTKKLGELLAELEANTVWRKVRKKQALADLLGEEDADDGDSPTKEVVTEEWNTAFTSTTNTLAALLKTPLGFDDRFDRRIEREEIGGSKRLAFGRAILEHARSLLSDLDSIAQAARHGRFEPIE